MNDDELIVAPAGYADWLAKLKQHIHVAQQPATGEFVQEVLAQFRWHHQSVVLEEPQSTGVQA